MKRLCRAVATIAVAVGLAASASAQDKGKKASAAPTDEKAMMEAMQKAMTPGEGQKKLEPLVGTFDSKVKTWMDPSQPPEDTVGTSVNAWVLGDRYVEMRYEGTFMGGAFRGIGYTGYDNVSKKYVSTWMDTAGTGMMWSTGTADASGQVMTFQATMSDPTTGKPSTATEKITIKDNDHHLLEMWGKGPDGKTFKMMEIQYTRKK
jgi:hypothetical protein